MMKSNAYFSRCRQYRYALSRIWEPEKPYAMIIALNPSTADHVNNDPTITRCIGFAKSWGYGGLYVANLFAYRATYPTDLFAADHPIGSNNDRWLRKLSREAGIVVAGWGNHGKHQNRSSKVKAMISPLHYLKLNKSGEPAHPLYLKANLKPHPWND